MFHKQRTVRFAGCLSIGKDMGQRAFYYMGKNLRVNVLSWLVWAVFLREKGRR